MTGSKVFVGAATRYIAGRNAMKTYYWKTKESSTSDNKIVKFSKTFRMGKNNNPPHHVQFG